ncbi:hypothetical protein SNE35_17945 [Paucibacter sp. R3-3]|uniref:Uncharacterized protein n=1 Tax=Roseateles agri TaxID=3098619 RepID=A0ABU5DL48_9BURK|nr:hypothetical protein [Paucibacter sp. R3-3]MDY0746400.1 hypothetical protein [Paucibacter sp. R3-3]
MTTLRYNVNQSGVAKVVTQVKTVVGATTFQGRSATQISVAETVQQSGASDILFAGNHYLSVGTNAVRLLGTASTFRVNGSDVTQTIGLTTALSDLDFSLVPGVPTSELTTATASFLPSSTAGTTFSVASTLQFAGYETVTVPAGIFTDACKFVQIIDSGVATTVTRWIAQTSGVLVRATRDGETQELIAATVNGTALAASAKQRTKTR